MMSADDIRPIPLRNSLQPLLNAELWVVGALTALGVVSEPLLWFAVIAGIIFALVRRIAHGSWLGHSADTVIALFILLMPLTLQFSSFSPLTLPSTLRLLTGIALFYAIANAAHVSVSLNTLIAIFACAGMVLAVGGVLLIESNHLPLFLQGRVPSLGLTIVNSNILAGAMAMLAPFLFATVLFSTRLNGWVWRLLFAAATAVLLLALAVTISRGGQLAAAVGISIVLILRWPRLLFALPLALLGGIAALFLTNASSVLQRFAQAGSVQGLDARIEIWDRALFMIRDVPLTGIGMGRFGRIADLFYPFFLSPANTIPHAHNIFLQIAVDLGIPGLIFWLALLGLMLLLAYRVYRWNRPNPNATLLTACGAGLFAGQIAMLTHGLVDAPLWNTRVAVLVWAIWGLVIFCVNRTHWDQKEVHQNQNPSEPHL